MVNSTQAVLMFMDLEPPAPSKLYDEVMEHLVKPGLLEEEYAKWLKEIVQIRKDIEHKKILEVRGEFVDEWIEKAEKYVEKMFILLNVLEIRKKEKILERTHEVMLKAAATAIKALRKLPENMQIDELEKYLGISIRDAFKRDFIDSRRIKEYYFEVCERIEELKREVIDKKKFYKLKGDEVEQLRECVRKLIHELSRAVKEESKDIEEA